MILDNYKNMLKNINKTKLYDEYIEISLGKKVYLLSI